MIPLYFAHLQWLHDLFRELTMNRASFLRIDCSFIIFSQTYYESTIFSRTYYEFTVFFANSLYISRFTDDSIICLPNSLKIYKFTINPISYSWIDLELTLFGEFTISVPNLLRISYLWCYNYGETSLFSHNWEWWRYTSMSGFRWSQMILTCNYMSRMGHRSHFSLRHDDVSITL